MRIGILIENPSNTKGPDVQANYLVSYLCSKYGEAHDITVLCKKGSTLHDKPSNVTVADILDPSNKLASVRRLHELRRQLDLLHVYCGNRRIAAVALFRSTIPILIGPSTGFKSPLVKYLLQLYKPPVVNGAHNPWELVCHTYDHPNEQMFCIPNGFDTDTFSPLPPSETRKTRSEIEDRHNIDLNTNIVIWVNHLTAHKRPQLGIEAFKQLHEQQDDTSFLLIGDGEQKEACQDRIQSVPDAHYLGYIHHNRIARYFQTGDVSLVTSRSEGFSNVIYESMACGLPVVTATQFDQIGTEELGRYLSVESSAAEIAEGLADALDRSEELGARAREHVIENHSISTFGEKYIKVYKWLLNRQERPSFSTEWVSETLFCVQGESGYMTQWR